MALRTGSGHAVHLGLDAPEDRPSLDPRRFTYSVVIPVFNSAAIVGETVDRTVAFFRRQGLDYELVLVNDASRDASWQVLRAKAQQHPGVVAVNLLRNAGQHSANLCGFRHATGDYVITMDDDLQNPPEEIAALIRAAMRGHDVVYGRFAQKQAAAHRSAGSRVIGLINRRIFGQPKGLAVSNFRILRRDVVDRICMSRSTFPYITGQSLLYSSDRASVTVRHDPRPAGRSSYTPLRLARLVLTILFSYSSFPLRLCAAVGAGISALAFLIGGVYLVRGAVVGSRVEGWTTLVVLLAFFNGVIIMMLSMLGEYVVRTLNQVTETQPYHVVETVGERRARAADA